jgi:hypothetical protein
MAQGKRPVRSATAAISFGVYADLSYNLYSATNSSPQTTELFAGDRSKTLWKYVVIGHAQAFLLGLFGSVLDRSLWPLFGTSSIGVVMHCMYQHALKKGQGVKPPAGATPTGAAHGQTAGRVRVR